MTWFPASVERWRALCVRYGGDMPIEFLLSWIKHESGGNPCSTGIPGVEAGLFQLYYPDDERYGGTFNAMRAGCGAGFPGTLASPSNANGEMHVRAGCLYVRAAREAARDQLSGIGATWPEDSKDFWSLVKLRHALPSIGKSYLPAFKRAKGRAPDSWAEWRDWYYGLSVDALLTINSAMRPWSSSDQRKRLFGNAEKTANVSDLRSLSGGMTPTVAAILAAIAGASWWFFGR